MNEVLVPIFICVVLPIAVVAITAYTRINSDNRRSQIILKAIEANNNIDVDKLAESLKKPVKSARQILNSHLLFGSIFSLIGLGLVASGVYLAIKDDFNTQKLQFTIYLVAAIAFAIGFGNLITYFITRKQVNHTNEDK